MLTDMDFRLIAIDWANGICSDSSIIWFSYKRIVWVDPQLQYLLVYSLDLHVTFRLFVTS
jgi:hypothetical protein